MIDFKEASNSELKDCGFYHTLCITYDFFLLCTDVGQSLDV